MLDSLIALIGSLVLCLLHLATNPLATWLSSWRERAISFAGGISTSYIFLHLLWELIVYGSDPIQKILPLTTSPTSTLLLLLLVSFVGYYAAHVLASRKPSEQRSYAFKAIPCVLYNLVVGGALLGEEVAEGPGQLALFVLALGLHMAITDYQLLEAAPRHHRGPWRLALALAPPVGLGIYMAFGLPIGIFYLLLTLISGATIQIVMRSELPDPGSSRIGAFLSGTIVMGLILMVKW